jgi:peroxiredoxin
MNTDSKYTNQVVDFALPPVSHGTGRLSQHLMSKQGAVIVFWSSVCSHCVRYDVYLNDFENRYPGIALLAVAAREHESRAQLLAALSQRELQFPLLHDADRAVAHHWFVRQTPTAFLIDANLQVIYRGAIDNFKYPQDPDYKPYLDAAIEALLGGRSPARPETATFGCPIESVYYTLPKPLGR